jgi:hypothetical protein
MQVGLNALRLDVCSGNLEAAMNTVFAYAIRKYALVFSDNILVCSKTLLEHKKHLRKVQVLIYAPFFRVFGSHY